MSQYEKLVSKLKSLLPEGAEGETEWIANLSNSAALLWEDISDINWAGFYLLDKGRLLLGPFQGRVACREIAIGKGVCGTAFQEKRTLVVEDVHQFPGHIACDERSRSEIVVPLYREGELVGVLDIDSPVTGRFKEEDKEGLEEFAALLGGGAVHTHEHDGHASGHTHEHGGQTHTHSHDRGHYHSPEEKKKQINRIARAIGHLQHVKGMIERDEDCADVLTQLSAVNAALRNLGKSIINEHMTHCISHAIEDGDTKAVEEFQKAVQKFI